MMMPSVPWITSSFTPNITNGYVHHRFPGVCTELGIHNLDTSNDLYVAFTEAGLLKTNNFLTLNTQVPYMRYTDIAFTDLYVSSSKKNAAYAIYANISNVSSDVFGTLTSSAGMDGVG